MAFRVAVPSWGLTTGGTRFGRFPAPGEPQTIFEKLEDCEAVFRLVRVTPGVSVHIPWDRPERPAELKAFAAARGLFIDSTNSNTFQDQPGQTALVQVRQPQSHRSVQSGNRPSSTTSNVWRSARSSAPVATPSGSATAPTSPGRSTSAVRSIGISRACGRSTRRSPDGCRLLPRAQALRAGVLCHGHQRLGHELLAAPASLAIARLRSSISATTRRTSTSSRWWRS